MLYFVGIYCFIIQVCSSVDRLEIWSYINMQCRDNENNPVDWWYIYKPPAAVTESPTNGLNFTYVIPGKRGFTASSKSIDANSMLQHTLAPFYKPRHRNYMAMVTYYNKDMGKRPSKETGIQSHGIMLADERGGIWMGHTVPNLLDPEGIRNTFPPEEISSGHLLTCLSLDIATLNLIADLVKETKPLVTALNIPVDVRRNLPGWLDLKKPLLPDKFERQGNPMPVLPFEFLTRDKSARVMVLVRRPGDSRCLYKTFAMYKSVILDVYQHDGSVQPFCEAGYGIRNIESISVKYKDGDVYYINNQTDKSNFAVNTAAAWQQVPVTVKTKNQFWSCTSNIEKRDGGSMGGIAMCVDNYSIWWAFTNVKVKEPTCPAPEVTS